MSPEVMRLIELVASEMLARPLGADFLELELGLTGAANREMRAYVQELNDPVGAGPFVFGYFVGQHKAREEVVSNARKAASG